MPDLANHRAAARLRAFRLIREIQDGLELPLSTVRAWTAEAESSQWPEVVSATLFLELVLVQQSAPESGLEVVERLLAHAERTADAAMTAVALASRCRLLVHSGNVAAAVRAERDLVRATVLLEGEPGRALERASAHIECAIAYTGLRLWELEFGHYEQVERLARQDPEAARLLPVVLYDRAESMLELTAAIREIGDEDAVLEQSRLAAEGLVAAHIEDMPGSWRSELQMFAVLLAAIAPSAVTEPVPVPRLAATSDYMRGYPELARALTADDPALALADARAAANLIDASLNPTIHDLALRIAAEREAEVAGRTTDGLVYARRLARLRWEARLSKLASMEALLHAERLRSEHALLSQHAYLDELTGLGNRRALLRYLTAVADQGAHGIALLLVDIDRFKDINDGYGHAVGDRTLQRVAALLQASVRPGDLAVRLGGDEFLLVLADLPRLAAATRAEAIRAALRAEPWQQTAPGLTVTASIGFACGAPQDHEAVLAAADRALYRSKAEGRDRASEG